MLCNRCSGLVSEDLRLGGLGADCGVDVLTCDSGLSIAFWLGPGTAQAVVAAEMTETGCSLAGTFRLGPSRRIQE